MTYTTEAAKLSRQPFFIVKLELDTTISPGGAEYHCSGRSPLGQLFHSTIPVRGYDPTPTRMAVGAGLGFRGQVRVSFDDFAFGDNGTYWGKLLANNPYYLDRKLRVYTGFYDGVTFDWGNFKEKLYFIKKIQGPDSKGRVTVTATDPLTQLDGDQSKLPTTPNAKLAAALNSTATGTLNITDNTDFSASGGVADIGGEYVKYSGISGADSIITTERNAYGTESKSHSSGDQVSPCYDFDGDNVVDVIRNLITLYSPIDHASYIPDTDWNYQRDNFLVGANAIGVYKAGTDIKKEIEKLCEQFRLSVWWDDEAQEIKLLAIGPLVTAAKRININEHILDTGEDVIRDPSKAVSETIVYYGRKNHSKDIDDKNNYSDWLLVPNPNAQAGIGSKIREIYAYNIPTGGTTSANNLADRINSQLAEGLITYQFQVDIKDADIAVGQVVEAVTDKLQGTDGIPVPTSVIIIERDQIKGTVYQYKAIKTGFALGSKYRKIAPSSLSGVTYTTATDEQKATYMFIASNATNQFSNNDDGHWIY